MIKLNVPCPKVVRVAAELHARHVCPFKDEVDYGSVRVEWTTSNGETLELYALAQLVGANAEVEISHENWTAELAEAVSSGANVGDLTVVSHWVTGGFQVEVVAPVGDSS